MVTPSTAKPWHPIRLPLFRVLQILLRRVDRSAAIDGEADAGDKIILDEEGNRLSDVLRLAFPFHQGGVDGFKALGLGEVWWQHDRAGENAVDAHWRVAGAQ